MRYYLLRIYVFLCMSVLWVQSALAQMSDDDDVLNQGGRGGRDDPDDLQGLIDYQPIRFTFQDIMTVVLILIACYVFGKIWKGCSYLILVLAVIFYLMLH